MDAHRRVHIMGGGTRIPLIDAQRWILRIDVHRRIVLTDSHRRIRRMDGSLKGSSY